MEKKLKVKVRDRWYTVQVGDLQSSPVKVLVDGDPVEVHIDQEQPRESHVKEKQPTPLKSPLPRQTSQSDDAISGSASTVKVFTTPMPGVIISVAVQVGDQLVTGDEICILEAMKMQQTLRADWTGIIKTIHVQPGQQVLDGDSILDLE